MLEKFWRPCFGQGAQKSYRSPGPVRIYSGAYRCIPWVPLVRLNTHSRTVPIIRRVSSSNAAVAVRLQYEASQSTFRLQIPKQRLARDSQAEPDRRADHR
jgi:hypothetical protein